MDSNPSEGIIKRPKHLVKNQDFELGLKTLKIKNSVQQLKQGPPLAFTSHFYTVKLGFTRVYILAHLSRRLTRWAYRMGVEPPRRPSVRPCVHPSVRALTL